jgi:lactate dehydrogenase-like 2-hydroxyacid dehydrogenase
MGAERKKSLLLQPKVAIYDCPKVVGKAISERLASCGYKVLFEGKLSKATASNDADIWVTKWTSFKDPDTKRPLSLKKYHPKAGIVSLSVGTEHIDKVTTDALGLKVVSCPTFSTSSVAEHAIALAMRSLYKRSTLPPLSTGPVIFPNFSDTCAERVVSQILFRSRQMESSMKRARDFIYAHPDGIRHDEPWSNEELKGLNIMIVGDDHPATRLAQMLKLGFNCNLYGYEASESLAAFNVEPLGPLGFFELYDKIDYIFLCTERFGMLSKGRNVDARRLKPPNTEFSGSNVAVLGTGRIGSNIARIARLGFNCHVTAFSTSEKEDLLGIGVRYATTVSNAIRHADFIFIALPLNEKTRSLISGKEIEKLSKDRQRVIINVTRDKILDSNSVLEQLDKREWLRLAMDVVHNDATLWQGGKPDSTAKKFMNHPRVLTTPHEGDCSKNSLQRMLREVVEMVREALG